MVENYQSIYSRRTGKLVTDCAPGKADSFDENTTENWQTAKAIDLRMLA